MSLFNLTQHFRAVVARNKILEGEHRHMHNQLMQSRTREMHLQDRLTALLERVKKLEEQRFTTGQHSIVSGPLCTCRYESTPHSCAYIMDPHCPIHSFIRYQNSETQPNG